MSLNNLDNGIESLHISMSIATNTGDMSMLLSAKELFLHCITALQCKLVGNIDGYLHIDEPGRLHQECQH